MKKLWSIISLLCACVLLFTACSVTDDNAEKTTENSTNESAVETSALSKEEQAQLQQDQKLAKEKIEKMLNSKTSEEIRECVLNLPEGYDKTVLEKYPDNDYVATAEKLGVYEKYDVYFFTINRTSDENFENMFIEVLLKTDSGYMIEPDEELREKIEKKHVCPSCKGFGFIVKRGETCSVCDGTLMAYNEKAYYDEELKEWQGEMQDCTACKGKGVTDYEEQDCATCKGKTLYF